jgi:hypothetical protein
MTYLYAAIIIILGIFAAASPEDTWRLSNSWQFEKAEPSEMALILTRLGGIAGIIAGILLIFGINIT